MSSWHPLLDREYNPLKAGSIDGTDQEPHDNGICRAMTAKYKPNKRIQGDPKCTLFVSRLTPKTNEEDLQNSFKQFGQILNIHLVRDIVTGFSKCYAFIEFDSEKSLRNAYHDGQEMPINDKPILVDYEHGRNLKNWVPRRLGGGFGGRKESGQLRFGCVDRPFRRPISGASQTFSREAAQRETDNRAKYDNGSRGFDSRRRDTYKDYKSRDYRSRDDDYDKRKSSYSRSRHRSRSPSRH